jgi:hypothetical protein
LQGVSSFRDFFIQGGAVPIGRVLVQQGLPAAASLGPALDSEPPTRSVAHPLALTDDSGQASGRRRNARSHPFLFRGKHAAADTHRSTPQHPAARYAGVKQKRHRGPGRERATGTQARDAKIATGRAPPAARTGGGQRRGSGHTSAAHSSSFWHGPPCRGTPAPLARPHRHRGRRSGKGQSKKTRQRPWSPWISENWLNPAARQLLN